MVYKTDIQVAIKGAKDLRDFQQQLKKTSDDVNVQNKLLRNLAKVNSVDLLPSIRNLNQALGEATQKFNQSVLGTKAATDAAKNLVAAERAVNKELQERERLLQSITLKGQTSSLTPGKSLFGQSVTPEGGASGRSRQILSESQDVQEALARMEQKDMKLVGQKVDVQERIKTILTEQNDLQKALLKLERKSTTELEEKAKLRAKNKQQFQSEVQALANQADAEKAAMQAEVEATKNIVAEEIKRKEAGKLSGIQRRQNMEMANKEVLLEMKLTKLAEKKARAQKFKGAIGSGLIGGAFPLLFGQGLGASVGGAAGGFGGGLMGGQFGFALSLVGTTVGAQFDKLAQSARQLGEALRNPIENMDMLITKMGQANTPFGDTVKTLKSLGLEAVAAGQVLDNFNKTFGTNKTSLAQLGEESIRFNNELAKLGTSITLFVAGPLASFLEKMNETLGITTVSGLRDQANAQAIREKRVELGVLAPGGTPKRPGENKWNTPFLKMTEGKIRNMPGVKERQDEIFEQLMNKKGLGGQSGTRNFADENLQRIIKERRDFELSMMKSQLTIEKKSLTMRSEDVNVLKRRINLLKIEEQLKVKGLVDTEIMTEEQERAHQFAIDKLKIEKQISEELLNQSIIMADPMQAALIDLNKQMVNFNNITFQAVEFSKAFGDAFSESFKGIISGTMSVQEAFANMFQRIADHFLDMAAQMAATQLKKGILSMFANAFTSSIGSSLGNAALPTDLGSSLTTKQAFSGGLNYFSSGGYVTRPTAGLVGEAGESEYIIPASKMASSMQRYSAGARGDAVVAGGGSSYAGGGAGGSATVNYSGPILNFNSEEFVPKSAVGQIIASASARGASIGENRTLSTLKNSRSRRSALGL